MIVFPASRPPGESDLGVLQRVRAQARPNRYERLSQYRRYHDDGAVALTAVALLSGQPLSCPNCAPALPCSRCQWAAVYSLYLFWHVGIAKLGPARAAIFMNLVPVASMVIAAFSGAPPNHAQLLGGALVIGAVTFSALSAGSAVAGTTGNLRVRAPPLAGTLHRRRGERPYRNVTGVRMPAIVAA